MTAAALSFDGRAALLAAAEAFARRYPADARSTALARHCRAVAPFVGGIGARDVVRAYALAAKLKIECGGVAARIRADACHQIASILVTRGEPAADPPRARSRAADVWRAIVGGLEIAPADINGDRTYLSALASIYRRELHVLGQ